jgi:adenylate cyclase class 2
MTKTCGFLRVRDEGDKVTMAYKQFNVSAIDGCEEIETIVNDFDKTIKILEKSGLKSESYQESRREQWLLDDTEIVIDEWPWVSPYVEIEGKDERTVKNVAKKLGFDWQNAAFGSVTTIYNDAFPNLIKTGVQISDIAEVKFGKKIPKILLKS